MKHQTGSRQELTAGSLFSAGIEPQKRDRPNVSYEMNHSPYTGGTNVVDAGLRFQRICFEQSDERSVVLSDHFEDGSVCEFTRLTIQGKDHLILRLTGNYHMTRTQGAGWLFQSREAESPHFWLPLQPMARSYDKFGRIVREETMSIIEVSVLGNESCTLFRVPEDYDFIEFVVWTLPLNSSLFDELLSLSPQEQQSLFLWGSHTQYTGPKDIYYSLIHGAIYKISSLWPLRKCKASYCETDAYSLYVASHGLWKITGKKIYQFIQNQLVFSVVARQDSDGAWRHGSLTDDFEIDYRHYCSGIHLLAADYEKTRDAIVGSSIRKAVDYMRKQCDKLSVGKWYLHDSLELNVEMMRKSPVSYQYSTALGKSPSNMLVLNTHLDALVALSRYAEVSGDQSLEEEIASGVNAAVAVLGLHPAEPLYRLLFKAIELTFLPDSTVNTLPLPVRAVRRLARQKLIPLLPRIKKIFPRLVMPNGYIDRNLSLNEFWYPYFLINVMDLLRFRIRFSIKTIETVIDNAVRFVERVGLEKWLNNERTAYAVGFWAEALYLYCLHSPDRSRAALAETAILLYASDQGIPPSLLGCNSEYICLADQVPCLWTDNDRIQVINLSVDSHHLEFILVNGTDSPQDTSIPRVYDKLMVLDQNGHSISAVPTFTVPPRGWMRLLSHNV